MFKKPNLDTLTKSRQKVYTSKLLTYLSNNGEQDASEYLNFLLNQKEEASTQKIDTTKLESIDGKILKVLEKIEENIIDEQDTSIKRKGRNGTGSGSSDSSNGLGNANGLGDEDEEGSGGGRRGPSLWLDRERRKDKKKKKRQEKERKKKEKLEKERKKTTEEKTKKTSDSEKTKTKPKAPPKTPPKTRPPKNSKEVIKWLAKTVFKTGVAADAVANIPGSESADKTKVKPKTPPKNSLEVFNRIAKTVFKTGGATATAGISTDIPGSESNDTKETKPKDTKKPKKVSETPQKSQQQENDIKKAKTETAKNIKQEAKTVKASENVKNTKLGKGAKTALKTIKGAGKALGAVGTIATVGLAAYEFSQAESTAERKDIVAEAGGAAAGAMAGAALGATIGSVIPGIGTLIGGALGGMVGGFLGSELGKGVIEFFKSPEDYVPDEIKDKGPEAILMYIDQVMYPQYIQGIETGDVDPDKLEDLADYRNEVQLELEEKNKKKEEAIKNYNEKISNPKKETSFLDKAKDIAVSAAKKSLIGKAVSFGLGLFSNDDSEDPKEEKAKETTKENIEAEASKGAEKESESIFSKVGKGLVKSIPVIGTVVTGLELASSALSATNLENDVIDIDETLKLSAKEIKAIIDNKNLDDFTKKRLQEDYKLALQIDAFKATHKDVEPSACVFLLKAKIQEAQTSLDALSENDTFSRTVLLDTIKMYNNLIEYYSNIRYDEKQFKVDFDKLTTNDSVKKSSSLETFSGPSYSFLDAGVQGNSSQPGQSVDLPPLDLKPSNAKFDENAELGILSKKYEAPGGVGTVSTGVGDPGGVSYGSWQLSTNAGTLGAYLKDTPDYAKFFGNAKPGSPEFSQRWKEIAKADPKGFEKSQHDFLYKKNFKGVLDYATSKGIDTSSKTIQNVLWSQAIQHGLKGNKTIINDALKNVDPKNNEEVIKAIYQSRSSYVSGLKMDGRTKASCIKRYKNEGSDALAMLANEKSGKPQVKTDDKTSTSSSSETNESTETKAQVSTSKGDTNASKTSSNNQQNTVTVKEQAALTAMQTVQNNINNNNSSNTNVNAKEKEDENKDHPKTAFIIKPLKGKFDF